MAASAVSSRPQTLRQARRAYQKAGATTRLSERQMRQLERSAELQERADRIKEREYRRKANLKKKNEKIEREREARTRMGIPSPVKDDVGASQMRLGSFLTVRVEANPICEEILDQPILPNCCERVFEEDLPASAQRDCAARSPLQPRSGNMAMKPKAKVAQMPPPPLPISKSMSKATPKRISNPSNNAPPKPQLIVDDWAAFLVSNTQIEREIRCPETAIPSITANKPHNLSITPSLFLTQSESTPVSTPCPVPASTTEATKKPSSTEDRLAQIRTQSLCSVNEVEQKLDLDARTTEEEREESEFGDDITDVDLEGAVLQVEQATTPKQEICLLDKVKEDDTKPKQTDSFCDDDFDISTQDLRDLVD
ncbi:MAG: hypothetical protein Q9195_000726 [Heterodermia aff. obscurata]